MQVKITNIKITPADNSTLISTPSGTLQMNADIRPSHINNKAITWSVIRVTGNANIDDNGLLTAVANGKVIVKATSVCNPTVNETLEITITNQPNPKIITPLSCNRISISPDPLTGVIRLNGINGAPAKVRLTDLTGNLIYEMNLHEGVNPSINISNIQKGIYVLSIQTEKRIFIQRISKYQD